MTKYNKWDELNIDEKVEVLKHDVQDFLNKTNTSLSRISAHFKLLEERLDALEKSSK